MLLLLLSACGFCLVIPAWRTEKAEALRLRAHVKALEDSLASLKSALTKLQIQHNVTRDELLACREEAIARGDAELRRLPAVDAANALLGRGGKS